MPWLSLLIFLYSEFFIGKINVFVLDLSVVKATVDDIAYHIAAICHVRGFCCLCVNSNCKPCSLISCITQVTEFDEGHRRDPIIALCIQKQNTKGKNYH